MMIRDLIKVPVSLYEMANLTSEETGLPFMVWVSPRDGQHDARVKVTIPPYGSHPIGVFKIRPFEFADGTNWLTTPQEQLLGEWVRLNEVTLIDFWDQRIHSDKELRERLIGIGDAPPKDHLQAVGVLQVIAPKVKSIRWHEGAYQLFFDKHAPSHTKIESRFSKFVGAKPIKLYLSGSREESLGVLLWPR